MANLKVEVSIKDTDQFQNILKIMFDMLHDERVPKNLRDEYIHRCREVVSSRKDIPELNDRSNVLEHITAEESLIYLINNRMLQEHQEKKK